MTIRSQILAVLIAALAGQAQAGEVAALCFTPGSDCAGLIVHEIGAARNQVAVQAYGFTHHGIARALVDANRRGVDVLVVLDSSQEREKYSSARFLRNAGIRVLIDDAHASAHNKVIVLDGHRTITGSFNFTKSAQERNAENVLIIEGVDVARSYLLNINAHIGHSVVLSP